LEFEGDRENISDAYFEFRLLDTMAYEKDITRRRDVIK